MCKIQYRNNPFIPTCPNALWIGEDGAAASYETSLLTFCCLCSGCWVCECELLLFIESGISMSSLSTLWQKRGVLSIQLKFVHYAHISIPGFRVFSGGYHPLGVFFPNFFLFLPPGSLVVTVPPSFLCFRRSRLRERVRFTNRLIGKVIFSFFGFEARHVDVLWNNLLPAGVRWLDGTGQPVTGKMHVRGNKGNRLRLRD